MFKSFNRYAPFNSPSFFLPRFLPRDAREEKSWGWNSLNGLNVLNALELFA
jgi:hypothetical protein